MNKVFSKSFWSQKFTFKTRMNDQENFFSTFFSFFSLVLVLVHNTKIGQNLSFSLDLVPVLNTKLD
jgi:hypothetical protein